MKINDQRQEKRVLQANVGDILISGDDKMYLVISSHFFDYNYGLLNLEDLEVHYAENNIEVLLNDLDNDYVITEIIPQNKISINIS